MGGIESPRELAAGIHPAVLSDRGLAAALDELAARLSIPVSLEIAELALPGPVEASVYFLCSEALTNVIKHAAASSTSVRISERDRQLIVEIRDDGVGGA
jgi:signal transduction histidine kinase